MSIVARHEAALAALKSRERYRELLPTSGLDFASNDYLGLSGSNELRLAAEAALARGVPVGAGASRLLRGNHEEHVRLEEEAGAFFGAERALFMGGGFAANTALFSTLPMQGDIILFDALIHASAHEGMKLTRADAAAFAHNDLGALRNAISEAKSSRPDARIWIAVESVYSMDGDLAPIAQLADIADEHDAFLVLDEAHATGIFGAEGRGLSAEIGHKDNIVTLHTCGKALGGSGALICGAAPLIDTLINRGRGFIYATAPSPLNAAILRAALQDLQSNPVRRENARNLARHAHFEAARLLDRQGFESQILPIIIGEDEHAMALAGALQNAGFDVRGIRPPTVPRGSARLRISITPNVSEQNITEMLETLAALLREHVL